MMVTCLAALTGVLLSASPPARNQLGLDLTSGPPSEAGSVLLVPWSRTGVRFDASGHARVSNALEGELPGRVISSETALHDAQSAGLNAMALRKPDNIYKLAKTVWAYRAITLTFEGRDVIVDAYDADHKVQLTQVRVPSAAILGKPEAAKIAKVIVDMLTPPPPLDATLNAGSPLLTPLGLEASDQDNTVSDSDLADAMKGPSLPPPRKRIPKPPVLRVAVGGGIGFNSITAHGSVGSQLAPISVKAVGDVDVYLGVMPLSLANPSIANAPWADFVVEGTYRAGFAHATGELTDGTTARCRVQDDEFMLRLGWRYHFQGAYAPKVGVGAGYGQDRFRFGCPLQVPSSSYRAFDVNLRVLQPLYKNKVWVELVVGPRFGLNGVDLRSPGPAIGGDLWAYWQIFPILYVRGGVRVDTTRLQQQPDLTVNTLRTSLALQLGVSL